MSSLEGIDACLIGSPFRKGPTGRIVLSPPGKPPSDTRCPQSCSGYLMKLKQSKWNKRWFEVKDGLLAYYKVKGDKSPAGWLRLDHLKEVSAVPEDSIVPGTTRLARSCFLVALKTRVLYLQAPNPKDLRRWLTALQVPAAPEAGCRLDSPRKNLLTTFTVSDSHDERQTSSLLASLSHPAPGPSATSTTEPTSRNEERGTATTEDMRMIDVITTPRQSTEVAIWTKCWDADSCAHYYVFTGTDQSFWTIPLTQPGNWALCWDESAGLPFYFHTGTAGLQYHAPQQYDTYRPDMPAPEAEHTPSSSDHPTWVECWDDTFGLPYYIDARTGESMWELPDEEAASWVVQYGSEDYQMYWQLPSEPEQADAAAGQLPQSVSVALQDENATDAHKFMQAAFHAVGPEL